MYGASVYPAPISLTGPRRSRALVSVRQTLGLNRDGALMEDQRALNHPRVRQQDSGNGLKRSVVHSALSQVPLCHPRLHLSSSLVTVEE